MCMLVSDGRISETTPSNIICNVLTSSSNASLPQDNVADFVNHSSTLQRGKHLVHERMMEGPDFRVDCFIDKLARGGAGVTGSPKTLPPSALGPQVSASSSEIAHRAKGQETAISSGSFNMH